MLRTFHLLQNFGHTKGNVISSLFRRQPIFLHQPNINKLAFSNLVRHCSTNSAVASTEQPARANENDSESNATNWNTIYHFPSIMLTASLKRLKFYPMVCTGVSVPISIGLAYMDVWSMTTAEVVGAIGKEYLNISFLDAKGKRQNRIYSVDDLVSRTELPKSFLKMYFPVKNHENGDVYKLVHQYGEIYDVHAFNKIFGHEVVTK
uniref:Transmembrane protein 186 n=1 Tax=Anopheles epiroticus TaxID=199890 RepID=A0A240PPL3_9DIPT